VLQEDYYFDANDDPIPIRWMAPESLRYAADGSLMVKKVTKEANIWYINICIFTSYKFTSLIGNPNSVSLTVEAWISV
jgi:hypothetical protein